jgi:hypothetical protein
VEIGKETSNKRTISSTTDQQTINNKKQKPSTSFSSSSAASSVTSIVAATAAAINKKPSVQNDPNSSDVFKSLFTTSDKAKNQQKAHWVTFNPQYY